MQKRMAHEIVSKALHFRLSQGIPIDGVRCIYDLADSMGIEVRFVDISSMEGMYCKKSPPTILITSHRPPGRQRYTCAHELAHHLFDHGSTIDELQENSHFTGRKSVEDQVADLFAGFFLMPKTTVNGAFVRRSWTPSLCTPSQTYSVACWLGVGYSTLINHMHASLRLISSQHASNLMNTTPKKIRFDYLGEDIKANLVFIDHCWSGRPIDIQVDDLLLLPHSTEHEGNSVRFIRSTEKGMLLCADSPGLARLYSSNEEWSSYVRVSRKGYTGLSIYRHLEEPTHD